MDVCGISLHRELTELTLMYLLRIIKYRLVTTHSNMALIIDY